MMMGQGAASSGTKGTQLMLSVERPKITINLMDVSFLEQNMQSILEVSNS